MCLQVSSGIQYFESGENVSNTFVENNRTFRVVEPSFGIRPDYNPADPPEGDGPYGPVDSDDRCVQMPLASKFGLHLCDYRDSKIVCPDTRRRKSTQIVSRIIKTNTISQGRSFPAREVTTMKYLMMAPRTPNQ